MNSANSGPERCRAVVRSPHDNYEPRHCLRPIAFDDPLLPMCQYHYTMATRYDLDFEIDLDEKYPDELTT